MENTDEELSIRFFFRCYHGDWYRALKVLTELGTDKNAERVVNEVRWGIKPPIWLVAECSNMLLFDLDDVLPKTIRDLLHGLLRLNVSQFNSMGKHILTSQNVLEKPCVLRELLSLDVGNTKKIRTDAFLASFFQLENHATRILAAGSVTPDMRVETLYGYNVAHVAVQNHWYEILSSVCKEHPDLIERKSFSYKETPLHLAIKFNDIEAVRILLDAGANINSSNIRFDTALTLAIKSKNEAVCAFIIQRGPDPFHTNLYDHTLMHFAFSEGMISVVRWLLEQGVRLNDRSHHGQTPLDMFLEKGPFQDLTFLSETTRLGATFNLKLFVIKYENFWPNFKGCFLTVLRRASDLNLKERWWENLSDRTRTELLRWYKDAERSEAVFMDVQPDLVNLLGADVTWNVGLFLLEKVTLLEAVSTCLGDACTRPPGRFGEFAPLRTL
jgi:hypothetical protein